MAQITGNNLATDDVMQEDELMNAAIFLAALSCHGLPPDAAAYCQARQNEQPAACFSIRDADTRTACLAEVGRNPAACFAIGDAAKRQECRNRAGL